MAEKLHGIADAVWLSGRAIRRIFGIADKTLADRSVLTRQGDGRIEYELSDFWTRCANLVVTKMRDTGLGMALKDVESLKAEKLAQEIRKLTIENDLKDGTVVLAEGVEIAYGKSIRAICDELDGAITAIKIAIPDVSQAVLSTVVDKFAEARQQGSAA
jgi:hypothetical protein